MTEFRPGRFQVLPTVVKNLIIINVIMVFGQFALGKYGIDLADYLGLHYWRSELFKPWQLLTHMFMHGSYNDVGGTISHIFFNMFALWMFGSVLENIWGPKRFLIFYIVCGIGAAVLHLGVLGWGYHVIEQAFRHYQQDPTLDNFVIFTRDHLLPIKAQAGTRLVDVYNTWMNNPQMNLGQESVSAINQYLHGVRLNDGVYISGLFDEATVGASGAVFGVLFAFGYLFPNTLIYLYFLVPIKAKYVVAGFALIELFSGIQNSAGDNVAHFAHLGGMIVAFILIRIWNKTNRRQFF